jgi:hypothetical protein
MERRARLEPLSGDDRRIRQRPAPLRFDAIQQRIVVARAALRARAQPVLAEEGAPDGGGYAVCAEEGVAGCCAAVCEEEVDWVGELGWGWGALSV